VVDSTRRAPAVGLRPAWDVTRRGHAVERGWVVETNCIA